jgi:hypothetical protein
MPLDDASIERYARQIILEGVGATGQARLLEARVCVLGDGDGADAARCYLLAAGVTLVPEPSAAAWSLLARADRADPDAREQALEATAGCVWYAAGPDDWRCGVAPDQDLPPIEAVRPDLCDEDATAVLATIVERQAACDAAAVVCARVLGWESGPARG